MVTCPLSLRGSLQLSKAERKIVCMSACIVSVLYLFIMLQEEMHSVNFYFLVAENRQFCYTETK